MNKILGKDIIVDINKIQPNSWNPKESIDESGENKKRYEEIKEQINKKGLFEAITVRELEDQYEILDGFHRWNACKDLGFTEIRVNNLGKIDDKLARAITLIKEQKKVPLSELKVAEIVGWFREQDIEDDMIKDLLGYTDETFDEYTRLFSFDWSEYAIEIDTDEEDDIGEKEDIANSRKTITIMLEEEKFDQIQNEIKNKGKKIIINKLLS